MFDNLTNKLERIFSKLKSAPSLNEEQVDFGLKEINDLPGIDDLRNSGLLDKNKIIFSDHADNLTYKDKESKMKLVRYAGLEPAAFCLASRRSTN